MKLWTLSWLALAATILATPRAFGQIRLTGTLLCEESEGVESTDLRIGSHHRVTLEIEERKCFWLKPLQILGSEAKEETRWVYREIDYVYGKISHMKYWERGSSEGAMSNGDTYSMRWWFDASKEPEDYSARRQVQGRWIFKGGTGRLKGIKGQGTYKGEVSANRTVSLTVEGIYWAR